MAAGGLVGQKGAVIVTGATGHIGSHTIDRFLKTGWHVVATVRNEPDIPTIREAFKAHVDRLHLVVIGDRGQDGPEAYQACFNAAPVPVTAFIHTAAPMAAMPKDPEKEMVVPHINLTLNSLKAAQLYGQDHVKRVVLTGSFSSMINVDLGKGVGHTYKDDDWNTMPREAAYVEYPGMAYTIGKLMSEKAAWEWMKETKPSFNLVVLISPMVFGPTIYPMTTFPRQWGAATAYAVAFTKNPPENLSYAGIDVRDMGEMHLQAAEREQADGRYILGFSDFDFVDIVNVARKDFGLTNNSDDLKKEETWTLDCSKAKRDLGFDPIPRDECLKATIQELVDFNKRQQAQAQA